MRLLPFFQTKYGKTTTYFGSKKQIPTTQKKKILPAGSPRTSCSQTEQPDWRSPMSSNRWFVGCVGPSSLQKWVDNYQRKAFGYVDQIILTEHWWRVVKRSKDVAGTRPYNLRNRMLAYELLDYGSTTSLISLSQKFWFSLLTHIRVIFSCWIIYIVCSSHSNLLGRLQWIRILFWNIPSSCC